MAKTGMTDIFTVGEMLCEAQDLLVSQILTVCFFFGLCLVDTILVVLL
jgi:hypothetical protein